MQTPSTPTSGAESPPVHKPLNSGTVVDPTKTAGVLDLTRVISTLKPAREHELDYPALIRFTEQVLGRGERISNLRHSWRVNLGTTDRQTIANYANSTFREKLIAVLGKMKLEKVAYIAAHATPCGYHHAGAPIDLRKTQIILYTGYADFGLEPVLVNNQWGLTILHEMAIVTLLSIIVDRVLQSYYIEQLGASHMEPAREDEY